MGGMTELILKEECYKIMGAAFQVYRELGCGFLEAVYQEAFEMELGWRGIPFQRSKNLEVVYRGRRLTKFYIADIVCYSSVVVEVKAIEQMSPRDDAQLLNYLSATGFKLGLLINFGHYGGLEGRRKVL